MLSIMLSDMLTWYALQAEHFILAVEPRCSGLVNLCKQSCKDIGGPVATVDRLPFPFPPTTVPVELPVANCPILVDQLLELPPVLPLFLP